MWRDRLFHTYRLPVVHSASTALQTPYVEVINPLLSHDILTTYRTLTDDVREGKGLFSEYVIEKSPPVPIATEEANPEGASVLGTDGSLGFLHRELDTSHARSVLGEDVIDYTLDAINSTPSADTKSQSGHSVLDAVKRVVGRQLPPSFVRSVERYTPVNRPAGTVPARRLAFRLYIVQAMFDQFAEDVRTL
jgi:hypothetical protein